MKPPTPNRWDQIVAQVIREHPRGDLVSRTATRDEHIYGRTRRAYARPARRRRHRAARRAAIPADQEKAAACACAPMGARIRECLAPRLTGGGATQETTQMTLLSKAQFARAVNVGKSRVTAYLKTKLIDGDAVVGEGRFAKIDLEKARAQLREQLSVMIDLGCKG